MLSAAKNKERLFLFATLFLAVFLLLGCSQNTENSSDGTTSNAQAVSPNTELTLEQKGEICNDYVQGREDNYCEDYCANKISDNRVDICADLVSEEKANCRSNSLNMQSVNNSQQDLNDLIDKQLLQDKIDEQQKYIDAQKDYNDCIRRWSDVSGYIKPDDADHCRRLYQP